MHQARRRIAHGAALDQDDYWLNQPIVINLIASKVMEQLYGFKRTHVARKRFAFDVSYVLRFSSCFDALFDPKTASHFSESALAAGHVNYTHDDNYGQELQHDAGTHQFLRCVAVTAAHHVDETEYENNGDCNDGNRDEVIDK